MLSFHQYMHTFGGNELKAIMIMFDSLRLDAMPGYGYLGPSMPNFERLMRRSVSFENSYVCSLPCMPARRELHTGRPNFLHRSWSPLEPFDDSMPELLAKNNIQSHLSTDHYHYLEDGGATYCGRYSSWDCFRGQESDKWQGNCKKRPARFSPGLLSPESMPQMLQTIRSKTGWQNASNREAIVNESDFPMARTFANGIDFMEKNKHEDNWFLQIETFDPHEPFVSPDEFESRWFDPDAPFIPDWPPYAPVKEDSDTVSNMRKKYFALAEYCDAKLGFVLDKMDSLDLWKDTMLIVNTDHGFVLGEHEWWGKGSMPDYNEVAHTPLFIWDPRSKKSGERRSSLVQTIDLAPTLLEYFNIDVPKDMIGRALREVIESDVPVRDYAIFGYHGGPINITDGSFVYMRGVSSIDEPFFEYTLMPCHMNSRFSVDEMQKATITDGFAFTKGSPVLRIPAFNPRADKVTGNLLFDLENDPGQLEPISDEAEEKRLQEAMTRLLIENEAPEEIFKRYDLE